MAKFIILIVIVIGVLMVLVGRYCKKKPLKIILTVLFVLMICYCIILSVDISRVNSFKKPIFMYEIKNKGAEQYSYYLGLGYKVDIEYYDNGIIEEITLTIFRKVIAGGVQDIVIYSPIDSKIINKLLETKEIVINNNNNNITATITDENIIEDILSILANATEDISGNFACDGTSLYFEMYDFDNKLIDSVDIWIDGNIMPKSIATGCAKYSLNKEDKTSLNTIIEQQTGTKFYTVYDYSEDCAEALELIYEDSEYKYYFPCIKSDKVFIEFATTGLKMTIKEALKNNHITISKLSKDYPDLFYKEKK